jgi:uracil phosphoribosyltransferase
MLATGNSLLASLEQVLDQATPKMLNLAFAIAAPEGLDNLRKNIKVPFRLCVGAIDQHLNEYGDIVPGLGDAGVLSYGTKSKK